MLLRFIVPLFLCLFTSFSMAAENKNISHLSFPNTEGEVVTLSKFQGKVVLVNLWATWCPPCVKEMPSMQRLKEKIGDKDFEIVAINAGEEQASVDAFLLQMEPELTFTILLDEVSSLLSDLSVRGLPMSFLVDREGNIVESILGGREWDSPAMIELINNQIAR